MRKEYTTITCDICSSIMHRSDGVDGMDISPEYRIPVRIKGPRWTQTGEHSVIFVTMDLCQNCLNKVVVVERTDPALRHVSGNYTIVKEP